MTAASLDPRWPSLAERLLEEFPEASITDVLRELRGARDQVEQLDVSEDEAIPLAAAQARERLSTLTGRSVD